jgi:hypothetical protein
MFIFCLLFAVISPLSGGESTLKRESRLIHCLICADK